MKKLILAAFALTTAASVFAQGTITFNTRATGTIIQHVYAPLTANPTNSQVGNGTADFPVGATDWSAYRLIGATGLVGPYGGSTTFAQLIGAPGSGVPEQSLVPANPVVSFRTAAAIAGTVVGTTSTLLNVLADGAATVQMVAWDDSSSAALGLLGYNISSWGTAGSKGALDAWQAGLLAAGESRSWNTTLGGTGSPPDTAAQSFNLYMILVPEPSTFTLAGLGLAALVAFRRRNK